ncbi:MAG: glycogen debranching enzyme GlgX [Mesorhizobium amorphae]|nr:MAG: glycogen debranching enzyme GlgX [Mesorhizobium amorphae]
MVEGVVPGVALEDGGARFCVRSADAARVWVSLFDAMGERETGRHELERVGADLFAGTIAGVEEGARYGLRADGEYAPERGLWFDPDKLLIDPEATAIDRPFRFDAQLAAPRGGGDTAWLMPKCVVERDAVPLEPQVPLLGEGGLVYELAVRAFTMRHPDVPETKRGTVAALAEPAVIAHLKRIGVSAVELMPVTAWMDERHLPPLGLSNAWGYNPVAFSVLDPRLVPGGWSELRETVAALRAEGIGTVLDVVFNHTAESDAEGPTLSLRGLDPMASFRHMPDGRLVNDTGTGNTLACDHPAVVDLAMRSLRRFVLQAGVDGFRFDLAPILGRTERGFDRDAPLLRALREDPVTGGRVLIAEPWDIGHDGYQLGRFGAPFGEWNDRFRDDVRRFWRGDRDCAGALATRLSGSFDIFGEDARTRTVNFLAAHDGMTLADLSAYERKHNEANGEANRDGHGENHSWNNGVEGATDDPAVLAARAGDRRALLATLYASRGTIMLTAGDEWGRSQGGNNNAYAQDNAGFWLDWESRDLGLEAYVAELAALRGDFAPLRETARLEEGDVAWLDVSGRALEEADWHDAERRRLAMVLEGGEAGRLAVCINGDRRAVHFALPERAGFCWEAAVGEPRTGPDGVLVAGRSIGFVREKRVG